MEALLQEFKDLHEIQSIIYEKYTKNKKIYDELRLKVYENPSEIYNVGDKEITCKFVQREDEEFDELYKRFEELKKLNKSYENTIVSNNTKLSDLYKICINQKPPRRQRN